MQQKRQVSRLGVFAVLVALVAVGGLVALMMTDIPATQKPVEKELDAKAFLGEKPQ